MEAQVTKKGDAFVLAEDPEIRVDARAHKMSKSRGNVINPDAVVAEYGADSLRLYEMFMGPLEAVKPWSMKGVEGVYRFLGRAWRMIVDAEAHEVRLDPRVQDVAPSLEQAKVIARTVAAVTDDLEALRFNTAISRLMEFVNAFTDGGPPQGGDGDLHAVAGAPGPSRGRRALADPRPREGSQTAPDRTYETDEGNGPSKYSKVDEILRDHLQKAKVHCASHLPGGGRRVHTHRKHRSPIERIVAERKSLKDVAPYTQNNEHWYPPAPGRPSRRWVNPLRKGSKE